MTRSDSHGIGDVVLALFFLVATVSSEPDLAPFADLPEDPPPKEIVRGQHYWVSNEERPENFRADLEKLSGGVYIGVGAEQNFVFAGWCKPDVMVLMDFDGAIPDLHRIFASVFKRAESKEQYVKLLALEHIQELTTALREDYPDPALLTRLMLVVKDARATARVHAERIQKGFIARRVPTYLNDDAIYASVRKLYVDKRVFIVRGDLTASATMQAIATAAKKANLPVRAVYLSNAEQYFPYNDGYRKNLLALPFDEKSLVLRTISWPQWGFAKDSNSYHYNVEGGLSFQSWLADANTIDVKAILDASDRKFGVSHLFTPPAAPAAPVTPPKPASINDAPPVSACLDVDVPSMKCVPGGAFLRGTDDPHKISEPARPQSTVWVQTMYMDTYEVTYADYKACEAEKKCKHAGPNYSDFDAPKQPMTGVSWFDSKRYCEARGKRLPTEAEWEHAARGSDGRTYPWGEEPATCERAVIMIDAGRSCGIKQKSQDHPDTGRPEVVGSRPPTLYGLYDMSGNSWEWVNDWFSSSYKECGDACAGVNPQGPCGGALKCPGRTERVVRGGSWYWPAQYATTYHRRSHTPSNDPLFHHFGFRCAADLESAKALAGAAAGSH